MQIGFNPQQYEPFSGPELLPAGDYPVIITAADAERTKDQTGGLLKVEFTVMPGHANAGRKLFTRLNLWNQNPESVAIAHKQLTSLCYSVGIMGQLNDTNELFNRPMMVKVRNDGQYNDVKAFMDANGNQPGKAGQSGPLQPAAPAPSGNPFGQPQQPQSFGPPQGMQPYPQQPQGFPPPVQGNPLQQQPNPFAAPSAPPAGNPFGQQPAPWGAPQQSGPPAGFVQPQAPQQPNPAQGYQQQPQQQAPPPGWPGAPQQ